MSELQRYRVHHGDRDLAPSVHGNYVCYSDVEPLLAELKTAHSLSGKRLIRAERAADEIEQLQARLRALEGLLSEAADTINGLADQQAMPDDFYKTTLDKITALHPAPPVPVPAEGCKHDYRFPFCKGGKWCVKCGKKEQEPTPECEHYWVTDNPPPLTMSCIKCGDPKPRAAEAEGGDGDG